MSGPYLKIPQVDYVYYCKIPLDFWISFLFPEGWIMPRNVFQSPQKIKGQLCSPSRMTPDWVVSFRDGAHVDCGALCPSQSMWGREIPGSSGPRKYVTLVHRLRWVDIVIRSLCIDIISYIKSMHGNYFAVWCAKAFCCSSRQCFLTLEIRWCSSIFIFGPDLVFPSPGVEFGRD